ncbi:transposase [Streptomyces sp. A30]|uniref:transposase n=1 Tax=Streptomyces sp. A30 TaxID=2789273 RepID=UPI0039808634
MADAQPYLGGVLVSASLGGVQQPQGARRFRGLMRGCQLRERCTKAKAGRILTIRPHHDLQTVARRQAATDPDWQADYRRWRPPVERAVAWLVHHGNRRLRHRVTIKNDTRLHTRAAALNLRRLINLGLTHTSGTWHIAPACARPEGLSGLAAGQPLTKIFIALLEGPAVVSVNSRRPLMVSSVTHPTIPGSFSDRRTCPLAIDRRSPYGRTNVRHTNVRQSPGSP